MTPRAPRLGSLDGLRLVSATAVLAYHYTYRGPSAPDLVGVDYGAVGRWSSLGCFGVNLFFMISGYVITWSASTRGWWSFAVGRVARLLPAYVAAMTLTALAMAAYATPPFTTDLGHWLANLTMFAPLLGRSFMDGAYWSIVVEVTFYAAVMLGLLVRLLPRRADACLAVWLAVVAIDTLALHSRWLEELFLTRFAAYFAVGIATFRVTSAGPSVARIALAAAAVALSFHAAELDRQELLAMFGHTSSAGVIAAVNAILIGALVLAIALGPRVGERRWLTVAGGLTYPLYLIHQNVGYIVIRTTHEVIGKWAALGLATAVSLAVAYGIWRCVEPVGRRWVRRALGPRTG